MILNLRPQDLSLLDCVVEEIDLRFGIDEQERILEVVGRVLGREDGGEEEMGEGGDEEGEDEEMGNGDGDGDMEEEEEEEEGGGGS